VFLSTNLNSAHHTVRFVADEIHSKQSIFEIGGPHLYPFGEDKGALKLACGDATMKILPVTLILLFSSHNQLIVLNENFHLLAPKAGHRQRYAQRFWSLLGAADPFDIVWRITFRSLAEALDKALDLLKTQK